MPKALSAVLRVAVNPRCASGEGGRTLSLWLPCQGVLVVCLCWSTAQLLGAWSRDQPLGHGGEAWRQSSWDCLFLHMMWVWKMVVVPGQEVGWRKGFYLTGHPSSLVWEGLSPGPYWKPLKPAESFTCVCIYYSHLSFSFSVFISVSSPPPSCPPPLHLYQ